MALSVNIRRTKKKGYALVFAGGGAKGAYQIGVWKALAELKIPISAVVGTSVGVLNAALFAMGDYKKAQKLWETMTIDRVITIPPELVKNGSLNLSLNSFGLLRQFWKTSLKNKGVDTSPLQKMVREEIDENKIRNSGIDFGLVTYGVSELRPYELFLESIPSGQLQDYILGSMTFPGFQATKIQGKNFMDGGIHDNIPFEMVKFRGYKKIIVADISGIGRNRRPDIYGTQTVYIKNSIDMGNIIDLRPEFIQSFMKLGYLDTLKAFDQIGGIDYFLLEDRRKIRTLEKLLFKPSVMKEYLHFFIHKSHPKNREEAERKVRETLPPRAAQYRHIGVALAEAAAGSLNLEKIEFYHFGDFLDAVWKKYQAEPSKVEFKNTPASLLPARMFLTVLKHYYSRKKMKNFLESLK